VLNRAKEDLAMLVELSMVEQRYDAVREVLDGASVKDMAIRYGVDSQDPPPLARAFPIGLSGSSQLQ
jgi:hypothetical protein